MNTQFKVSAKTLLLWFMLGGLILLFTPRSITNKLQFAFARLFHWPLTASRTICLSARPYPGVSDDYAKYENHIHNLEKLLYGAHKKIEKLSELKQRRIWENTRFVIADVTRDAVISSGGKLVINRGSGDGLAKGQYVLGDNSIIGVISEISANAAQVRMFTDPSAKMVIEVANYDISRIMNGCGNNSAKIPLLPKKYNVKTGDIIYAAAKAGFLNVPVITGKVTACSRDIDPLLWDITVKPVCDIQKLSNVAIIIPD